MISRLFSIMAVFFGFVLAAGPIFAADSLKIVESENVCMVTDMYFGKKQIPVAQAGKTYYGCCENCKETLTKDAKARTALDPLSGKSVDKAKAVIAAKADNSVLYFESRKNFEEYLKWAHGIKAPKSSSGQSHH